MSTNYIDEYMVKLGAVVDASGMQRFNQALREASVAADASFAGIAVAAMKAQVEIVSGFAAIGGAALGLVDKVAMADQQYRLFALHMYMSKDAARSLKVAMDALGEPMENLAWDAELRERTRQLIEDQRAMAPNGDYEAQLRKVRDIRFEFTRMEVEGEYLAMHVVQDFMKALGFGPDELLGKLRQFNDWVTHNLPQISAKLVQLFLPVWRDVKEVFGATAEALSAMGLAFTNIVGALSGDTSIEGSTFNFEKFADAIAHVAHWMAIFAEILDKVVTLVAEAAAGVSQLFSAVPAPILDAAIGAAGGYYLGGPYGAAAGAVGGALLGAFGGGSHGAVTTGDTDVHAMIDTYAAKLGVDPALAHAVAMTESGESQSAVSRTGARGIMQLTQGTASGLGVDRYDADDNVRGGVALLSRLMKEYGSVPLAVAAYHEGEPKMNAILAGRATLSSEGQGEVAAVMARMGQRGDVQIGDVTIHITQQPGQSNKELAREVAGELRDMQNKRTQRNLMEFQDLSPSY